MLLLIAESDQTCVVKTFLFYKKVMRKLNRYRYQQISQTTNYKPFLNFRDKDYPANADLQP